VAGEQNRNGEVIEQLYKALDEADGETMASLYTEDATFQDPAFGELHGPEVGDMWRMLCSQAQDLSVDVSDVISSETAGSARWVAHYTFSATGRSVENRVTATFKFRRGRIAEHRDSFSMWRWAWQALGPAGLALGSNPAGQVLLRRKARGRLEEWRARSEERV
jgi:ketosteroid isomerase-like protein